MDFKTALDLARTWLEDCDRDHLEGYVVIFNGVVAGWKRELDNPQGWEPGCLAINHAGDIHQAVGGDAYNGAQAWLPTGEATNTKAAVTITITEKTLEDGTEALQSTIKNLVNSKFSAEITLLLGKILHEAYGGLPSDITDNRKSLIQKAALKEDSHHEQNTSQ